MTGGAAEAIFTFGSTQRAIGGEETLLRRSVKVKVMSLPSGLGAGCGICLRVGLEELAAARRALSESGLEPEGVYRKIQTEGGWRYEIIAD